MPLWAWYFPFLSCEEQHLRYPLIRIDSGRQRCGIRDLQRYESFPLRLKWRHIHNNSAPRVRALADTNRQTVARDAEILDGARQRKGIGRHDAHVARELDEGLRIEPFRIDDRR